MAIFDVPSQTTTIRNITFVPYVNAPSGSRIFIKKLTMQLNMVMISLTFV